MVKTKNKKMKETKEIKALIKAIHNWIDKHEGRVDFHCGLIAFDKDFENDVEDRLFVFGVKNSVIISLEEMLERIKKEKKDFINW